jgi:hypothetical protein
MAIQRFIFLGYLKDKEIHLYLQKSARWKNDQLLQKTSVVQAERDGKEYIGLLLPPPIPFVLLKQKQEAIKTELQLYCPKLNLDTRVFYFFPQTFVS